MIILKNIIIFLSDLSDLLIVETPKRHETTQNSSIFTLKGELANQILCIYQVIQILWTS